MNITLIAIRSALLGDASPVIDRELFFRAEWAATTPAMLFIACLFVLAIGVVYYFRATRDTSRSVRRLLTVLRTGVLLLVVLMFADPAIRVRRAEPIKSELIVVLDLTRSMNSVDREKKETRHSSSRLKRVKTFLTQDDGQFATALREKYDVHFYGMHSWGQLVALNIGQTDMKTDLLPLKADADRTYFPSVIVELKRLRSARTAGAILFSDFRQSSSKAILDNEHSINDLPFPIWTVACAPESTTDVAIELSTPRVMRAGQQHRLRLSLRQNGLTNQRARLSVFVRPTTDHDLETLVDRRELLLKQHLHNISIPFHARQIGSWEIVARIDPLPGESSTINNATQAKIEVRDDRSRVYSIEHEPSWQWRFLKEAFERDDLIQDDRSDESGFRTYLASAEKTVVEQDSRYVATLAMRDRHAFFSNDVIVLGDMPAENISTLFCDRLEEWVAEFGGGLIVIASDRFGHHSWTQDPRLKKLTNMLPIVPAEPAANDGQPKKLFPLVWTDAARQATWLSLERGDQFAGTYLLRDDKGWENFTSPTGGISWFQPVKRVRRKATVLARHPYRLCSGESDPRRKFQPLIVTKRYGKGHVVYFGFDELWRLRKLHGDLYFQRLWGQLTRHLGMRSASAERKRFILEVQTDRSLGQGLISTDQRAKVVVTVYDHQFRAWMPPILSNAESDKTKNLIARLYRRQSSGELITIQEMPLRHHHADDRFEVVCPKLAVGHYVIEVIDPVTGEPREVELEVVDDRLLAREAEMRNTDLDLRRQKEIARAEHDNPLLRGKSYDLSVASETLVADLLERQLPEQTEVNESETPIWPTWTFFCVVVSLLITEWFLRKRASLL